VWHNIVCAILSEKEKNDGTSDFLCNNNNNNNNFVPQVFLKKFITFYH